MKKQALSALLSLVMVIALSVSVMASAKANDVTMTNTAQVAELVFDGYNQGEKGPVQIIKAKYTSNQGNTFDVYTVFVSGTENEVLTVLNNGTSLDFAALNIGVSPYLNRIKDIICENIPVGSRLFLVGHSLGGMMTQQLATDDTIKDNFIVKFDMCYAAPLTNPDKEREGGIARIGDVSDIVPFETANLLTHPKKTVTYARENGGYGIDFWTAHMNSYMDEETWGEYDVTGKKGGSATLTFDMSTRTFYKADIETLLEDIQEALA